MLFQINLFFFFFVALLLSALVAATALTPRRPGALHVMVIRRCAWNAELTFATPAPVHPLSRRPAEVRISFSDEISDNVVFALFIASFGIPLCPLFFEFKHSS